MNKVGYRGSRRRMRRMRRRMQDTESNTTGAGTYVGTDKKP
jgi:hypothetical protein